MKILFIGNRINVFTALLQRSRRNEIVIYALKNSLLAQFLDEKEISYENFELKDKKMIIETVNSYNHDILISNGCPFILPVNEKIMLNIHPTFLPFLRGKTPLNGVLYNNLGYVGATMHYINDEIDSGNIIYQEKHSIDNDIDLGLVYYLSFYLEGVVFQKGWEILEQNNFKYEGIKIDLNLGSYFNRTKEKQTIDFLTMSTERILRTIKSFGIKGQGVYANNLDFGKNKINLKKIYDAEVITNQLLQNIYENSDPGLLLLEYDDKFLIKTLDGIIKVIRYE